MDDNVLDDGKSIYRVQKMNDEALINAHKYHSKEAQKAYIAGFCYGANLVVSDLIRASFLKAELIRASFSLEDNQNDKK